MRTNNNNIITTSTNSSICRTTSTSINFGGRGIIIMGIEVLI